MSVWNDKMSSGYIKMAFLWMSSLLKSCLNCGHSRDSWLPVIRAVSGAAQGSLLVFWNGFKSRESLWRSDHLTETYVIELSHPFNMYHYFSIVLLLFTNDLLLSSLNVPLRLLLFTVLQIFSIKTFRFNNPIMEQVSACYYGRILALELRAKVSTQTG